MLVFTTRNRPAVLEYSLKKTREHYDGEILVIDDNSDTKTYNQNICKNYDARLLYNETRLGIPRSKNRGFNELLSYDRQFWFDDDAFPKAGWLERITEAQQYEPHLLYLKEWAHICREEDLGHGLARFSGATACFMSFTKEIYKDVHGFAEGYGIYGGWHHNLTLKLAGRYVSLTDASDYIYSFDLDKCPEDFKSNFNSSLPQEERVKK